MKKFFASLMVTGAMLFSINAKATNDLSISEQQINQYLAQKAGKTDHYQIPGILNVDYKLQNMSAKIAQNNDNRVEMSGVVDSVLNFQNNNYAGKLNIKFDTIPYYDATKGAIYLKDLRILNWSASPESYRNQITPIMPFLQETLTALLASQPVYKLDETKPRDVIIKKFAKGIKIEPGKLSIETIM